MHRLRAWTKCQEPKEMQQDWSEGKRRVWQEKAAFSKTLPPWEGKAKEGFSRGSFIQSPVWLFSQKVAEQTGYRHPEVALCQAWVGC